MFEIFRVFWNFFLVLKYLYYSGTELFPLEMWAHFPREDCVERYDEHSYIRCQQCLGKELNNFFVAKKATKWSAIPYRFIRFLLPQNYSSFKEHRQARIRGRVISLTGTIFYRSSTVTWLGNLEENIIIRISQFHYSLCFPIDCFYRSCDVMAVGNCIYSCFLGKKIGSL